MVRILGFLVGLGFVGVAAWSLLWGVIAYVGDPPQPTAEHRFHEHPHDVAFSFDGPFGRFDRQQRLLHIVMMISFFVLALTGMSLKFSYTGWAQVVSRALGGFESMGVLHRLGGIRRQVRYLGRNDARLDGHVILQGGRGEDA